MKYKLLVTALILILFSCQSRNQLEPCKEFDVLAIEMDSIYKEVLNLNPSDNLFVRRIESSQVKWIGYRNSYIHALYTKKPELYGDTYKDCRCTELNEMQKFRIAQLKMWLDGSCADSACLDSRNTLK